MLFGNDFGTGESSQDTHGRKGMYRFWDAHRLPYHFYEFGLSAGKMWSG
jgi:hypothetical protein